MTCASAPGRCAQALADAGHEGLAMAKAMQLTRTRAALAVARGCCRRSAAGGTDVPAMGGGGMAGATGSVAQLEKADVLKVSSDRMARTCSSGVIRQSSSLAVAPIETEVEGSAEPHKRAFMRASVVNRLPPRVRESIVALEMIRKLPEDIWASLLPPSSLLMLLTHRSRHVRDAALPLLRRDFQEEPRELVSSLVTAAVACLQLPETRHHALKALEHIISEKHDAAGEVTQLASEAARRALHAVLDSASHEDDLTSRGVVSPHSPLAASHSSPAPTNSLTAITLEETLPPSAVISGLLGFLHRATLRGSDSESEAYAAELLAASQAVRDPESTQELLDALLRLKAEKRGCASRLLEADLRKQVMCTCRCAWAVHAGLLPCAHSRGVLIPVEPALLSRRLFT